MTGSILAANQGELPVCVPVERIFARSQHAVLAVSHLEVYSDAVIIHLVTECEDDDPTASQMVWFYETFAEETATERTLRVAVVLPDGFRVRGAYLAGADIERDDTDSSGYLLHVWDAHAQSGVPTQMSKAYFLRPLPPPQPFRLICDWPAFGVEGATIELDGAAITAAASRVQRFWP